MTKKYIGGIVAADFIAIMEIARVAMSDPKSREVIADQTDLSVSELVRLERLLKEYLEDWGK